ncbi:MFS transporter [Ramlibacter humi]|uniref:MFS transporter n=1 Tax=Ramlibacter humi TaxID=2530451 RepID=A0A4Z0BD46_9BURK|nr:MFS transporter [Ramlibacter humi]
MRLWFTRLLGGGANQMLMVAIGWQMYELTGRAWDLGLVGLFQFAPVLLFTLLAGDAADRFHRSAIIACAIATQIAAAVLLLYGTTAHALSRELLLTASVLLGVARTFQQPAQQSLVPLLVPLPLLPRAMAFSSAGNQIAVIGGPGLGGLLFAYGITTVYWTAFGFLVLAFLSILGLRYERVQRAAHAFSVEGMLAGARYVFGNKVLLGAVSLDLMAVLFGGATALLPIFAKDILHVGPTGLGMLRAAPAAGALLMSVVLTQSPLQRRIGRKLLGSVALYGVCMLVFAVSHSFLLSLLALAISGGADMVSVVVRQTLLQMETPDDMRGRVGAVSTMFIGASNQLGEFESGATAALMGAMGSVVFGAACTLGIVWGWKKIFPPLWERDRFGS